MPGTVLRRLKTKKQIVLSALLLALLAGVVMTAAAQEISDESLRELSLPESSRGPIGYDVTYTYRKPDDLAEAIQTIRDYLEEQGGYLIGDERQGEFIIGGQTEGIYQVTGDTVTVSFTDFSAPGRAYTFSFDKPRNMNQAVQSVRSGINEKKGFFTGDEQRGSFNASGIVGSYTVTEKVNVTITDKPALIPYSIIEKEIIKWFKDM
ncbi:MAG: hypothetical protein LBQ94_06985 [Treponema sp.]|jgi:hypothetical protein|nr:hypothetical protein [Treponema sp.]